MDGNLRDLARAACPKMLQVLISIAENEEKAAAARVTAASAVLDRGYGKPPATLGDEDGNALNWIDVIAEARRRG